MGKRPPALTLPSKRPVSFLQITPTTENEEDRRRRLAEEKEKADANFKKQLTVQKQLKEYDDFNDTHFQVDREIGRGNGGSVELVTHVASGRKMARKVIMLEVNEEIRRQIIRELKVLEQCNHDRIVAFYGSYNSRHSTQICMCMQYMDGGSLDKIILRYGRVPELITGACGVAILDGLSYLKKNHNIIHRDVKPSNVLVNTRGDIKLCDFGVSGQLVNSIAKSFVGTRSYMAPERLQGDQHGISSDIWSLGLSLLELALGRYPIPVLPRNEIENLMSLPEGTPATSGREEIRQAIFELLSEIIDQDPPKVPSDYFSQEFCAFIDMCLQRVPEQRAGLDDLLSHDFAIHCREYVSVANIAEFVNKTIKK